MHEGDAFSACKTSWKKLISLPKCLVWPWSSRPVLTFGKHPKVSIPKVSIQRVDFIVTVMIIFFAACDCHPLGTSGRVCGPTGEQCPCKPGYTGAKCDQCDTGYYGFPNCRSELLPGHAISVHIYGPHNKQKLSQ